MSAESITQIVLVIVAGAAVLVLVAAARHRKHRARLAQIAVRHAMTLSTGSGPASLVEKAGRFQGRAAKARLRDLLSGHGENLGCFLAYRRVGRTSHQLLYFELGGSSHLDGFFVMPEADTRAKGHDFLLQWRAPQAQWSDERALSMAARVMHGLSRASDRSGATPLGIELAGRKVWIYSRRSLRGDALERFVEDAMRLRQLLLKSLQRANDVPRAAERRSGAVVPARPAVQV